MKTQSKRLKHFARVYSPANDPAFRPWHGVLLVLTVALFLGQQYVPGLIADPGRYPVASWEIGIYVRLTAFFLACWTVFGVRAMHPLMLLVQVGQIWFFCSRIAEIRITHEPLSINFAILALALALTSIRIITRPNEYELAQQARKEARDESV